jgi:hypothetical protein
MNSIYIGLIGWWIASGSGIIQDIKHWLMIKRIWYITDQFGYIKERRLKPLDCEVCMGFWLGLIITQDLQQAVLSSVFAILTSKIMNRL